MARLVPQVEAAPKRAQGIAPTPSHSNLDWYRLERLKNFSLAFPKGAPSSSQSVHAGNHDGILCSFLQHPVLHVHSMTLCLAYGFVTSLHSCLDFVFFIHFISYYRRKILWSIFIPPYLLKSPLSFWLPNFSELESTPPSLNTSSQVVLQPEPPFFYSQLPNSNPLLTPKSRDSAETLHQSLSSLHSLLHSFCSLLSNGLSASLCPGWSFITMMLISVWISISTLFRWGDREQSTQSVNVCQTS